ARGGGGRRRGGADRQGRRQGGGRGARPPPARGLIAGGMTRVRVAYVVGTTTGGVGRHVRMLAAGMARLGHRVVVAGPPEVEDRFGFTASGARFVPVPVSDRPHPVNDARAVRAVRRVIRDADVAHAHGLRAGALAALARPGRSPLLVVTLHNALTAGGFVGA